ncbi:histidinol-phosphatase [Mariniphaga sediminis]|uniref:Histidinol-phosphatase n=1 Tax=Mariniphaga sediminis TaxID=1628158 RepID=A0A399D6V9_9BACT|nr:Sb-PDE family phosphodiesterase [Mariniphaga sediminis]RIH67206.1 histidinol-phosphatase [Mariniphaga sediminis]
MKILKLFPVLLFCSITMVQAQTDNGVFRMDEFRNAKKRPIIQIPGFDGYQTLKCDFHMHTVFSDGHVWPTVRVQEAWQEGLDVIAITDHVEYTPHSGDVKVDHNRAWELAKGVATQNNIVIIKGTEITRATPPGHFNAIFIGDASGYVEGRENEKDKEAVSKAVAQDAFIFWNHPGWKASQIEGSYEWIDFVDELHNEKVLNGIEVFNGFSFHKKALDWCIDNDLTVMGSSDIHNLVKHDYDLGDYIHRSMTLVFAKERTAESVREALAAGRTVAWSSKYIAGKEEHVRNLFFACVEMGSPFHSGDGKDYFELKNNSDLYFELELTSGEGTKKVTLYPRSAQVIFAAEGQQSLEYKVLTAFVKSNKNLVVNILLN